MRRLAGAALLAAMAPPVWLAVAAAQASGPAGAAVSEHAELRRLVDATGFAGTVLVWDAAGGRLLAGHGEQAGRRQVPASTFKIPHTLIALEEGVVADGEVVPWDGTRRERAAENRDHDLASAFGQSIVPFYQELARRLGLERERRWLDRLGYGNRDPGGDPECFWLDGPLAISPREQVEFLSRLARGDLPVSPGSLAILRRLMVVEERPGYVLRGKTGWARLPEGDVGWFVGWLESDGRVYAFAARIEGDGRRDGFGPARMALARQALAVVTGDGSGSGRPEPILPGSIHWVSPPGVAGLQAAWLLGGEHQPGLYVLRVKLAQGARIPPHSHPDERSTTVLDGTLQVGFGQAFDPAAMVAVPAGGVYVAPANQPHYLWAREGAVLYQENGMGPTGTVFAGR